MTATAASLAGFPDARTRAQRAWASVSNFGYRRDAVGASTTHTHAVPEPSRRTVLGHMAAEGAGIGGAIGGSLGAIAAAVAAVGTSIALPGLDVVVAGPLAGAIAGAGVGAATGGLLGALIGWGIPVERVGFDDTRPFDAPVA